MNELKVHRLISGELVLINFLFLLLKSQFKVTRDKFYFFKKFSYLPDEGVIIKNIQNIKFGKNIAISDHCTFYCQDYEAGSRLEIGNNVKFNRNVMLNSDKGGRIYIGDDVLFGPNVVVRAANHNFSNINLKINEQGHSAGTIIIEKNVWVSANVTILPNVKIGEGSVIAAGSVVTKDIKPFSVAAGVPAKIIKSLIDKR